MIKFLKIIIFVLILFLGVNNMVRTAKVVRKTSETDITIELNLDGTGENLEVKATGDLTHHIIEDIGITLGESFHKALGDKKGINRYGFALVPMDETLARCALDFSGRKALILDLNLSECDIEDAAIEDIRHFFISFAENAKMNLHLHILYGEDQHHKVEAAFKALARAIKEAKTIVTGEIPSTKGIL
jgi:imidazoleglycerol-phosphate dehydratase